MPKVGMLETSIGKYPINCDSSGNFSMKIPDELYQYVRGGLEFNGENIRVLSTGKNEPQLVSKSIDSIKSWFNRLVQMHTEKGDQYRVVVMYEGGRGLAGMHRQSAFSSSEIRGSIIRFAACVAIEHRSISKTSGEQVGCPTYFIPEQISERATHLHRTPKFVEDFKAGKLPVIPELGQTLNGYEFKMFETRDTPEHQSWPQRFGGAVIDYDEAVVKLLCGVADHLSKVNNVFTKLFGPNDRPFDVREIVNDPTFKLEMK